MFLKPAILASAALVAAGCFSPVAAEVELRPSFTAEESYDTNASASGSGKDKVEDYVTTLSTKLELLNDRKDFTLKGFYRFNSVFHARESSLDYTAHAAGLDLKMDTTPKTTISASEAMTYTKESLVAGTAGIQTPRTDIFSNTVSLSAGHQLSPLSSARLTFSNSVLKYEDPTLTDTMVNTGALAFDRTLSPSRSGSLAYSYSNYYFDAPTVKNTKETHSFTLGVKQGLQPTLTLDLNGGAIYTPESGIYSWGAGASLAKSFKSSLASIGYSRSVSHSSGLTDDLTVNDSVYAGLTHSPSRSLSFAIAGNMTKSRSEPSARVDITSYSAAVSGTWRPYQWMALGLGFSRFQQHDAVASRDLSRNRVYATVTVTPSSWRF